MVNSLESEVKGHELNDWAESHQTGANSNSGEASLGNWSVPNTAASIPVPHALRNLVGTVVLGNFLTNQENVWVSLNLLAHRTVDGLANR